MPETIRTPVFTRYELLEELGSGGMGAVYKARQKFVGRLVAFKVLPPALRNDDEALERFEREAGALGRLKHPNVVAVFDAGVEGGFPYLAMEYVEGKNLRQVLNERGRLSVAEVVRLGIEMADALDHVQSGGLVHRDVKPSNIIIDPDGKAMLTDFGIAFAATLPRITQGAMGTPEFMSPEQADGKPLDIRSDLYSLGAVLYECLAGTVPFKREGDSLTSLSKLLNQVLHEAPSSLRAQRPDVPDGLADAVHRCMAKDPNDRFQTGAALADALRQDTTATPETPPLPKKNKSTPTQEQPPPPPPTEADRPAEPQEDDATPVAAAPPPPPKTEPETQPTKALRKKKSPPDEEKKKPDGWTGSFFYRSNTTTELPDAPPESLPARKEEPEPEKPSAKAQPDKKARKPRAGTAFKFWLVIGICCFAYLVYADGIPPVLDGLMAFHALALTPALAGALTTLASRSKQKKSKIGRGILLGMGFGAVLSLAIAVAIATLVLGGSFDSATIDEEMVLFMIAAVASTSAVSAILTGLLLGLKSLFSST